MNKKQWLAATRPARHRLKRLRALGRVDVGMVLRRGVRRLRQFARADHRKLLRRWRQRQQHRLRTWWRQPRAPRVCRCPACRGELL